MLNYLIFDPTRFRMIHIVRRGDYLVPQIPNPSLGTLYVLHQVNDKFAVNAGDAIEYNLDSGSAWLLRKWGNQTYPTSFTSISYPSGHELMLVDERGVHSPLQSQHRLLRWAEDSWRSVLVLVDNWKRL